MKILFLHGWAHGHDVLNPKLPDEDFAEAVRIAQAEIDRHRPEVVVGSSRGGAVAMNINSGTAKLVLLCPAWKKWGTVKKVNADAVILDSRLGDVGAFNRRRGASLECVAGPGFGPTRVVATRPALRH